ncbi:MAG TPA: ABC transporter ATP-binding protein [Candidatus Atribacteria bacterium]|nr:ABC transporter ATP-binding protein [Candidatus Atribacteria bacterium]
MHEEPILKMKSISKKFGSVQALYQVDFELYPNEILGLLGDNGAGKSTLIKIISGVFTQDEGEIFIRGKSVTISDPAGAKELGIETVYQDLALATKLNIAENIFLGREKMKKFLNTPIQILDKKKMEAETRPLLERLRIALDPKLKVGTLSGGQRQATAIAKSVFWEAKIIIMDEPTAALGVAETAKVRQIILDLKKHGASVILISHNLEDVFSVADRAIVLRGGMRVGDRIIKNTTRDEIVKLMISGEQKQENNNVQLNNLTS